MAQLIGFAANGGSNFEQKRQGPCFADNHGDDLSADGVCAGVNKVLESLDAQQDGSWVKMFKDSRYYISKSA